MNVRDEMPVLSDDDVSSVCKLRALSFVKVFYF